MTPDELRVRVAEFMEENDLHDDGEHTCGYSHDLLGHNIESLYREALAEGVGMACRALAPAIAAVIDECAQEAQQVNEGGK